MLYSFSMKKNSKTIVYYAKFNFFWLNEKYKSEMYILWYDIAFSFAHDNYDVGD